MSYLYTTPPRSPCFWLGSLPIREIHHRLPRCTLHSARDLEDLTLPDLEQGLSLSPVMHAKVQQILHANTVAVTLLVVAYLWPRSVLPPVHCA